MLFTPNETWNPGTRITGNVFNKKESQGNFDDIDTGIGKKCFFCLKQRCSHYKFSDPPIKEEPSSTFIMMNHFLRSEHSLARSQTSCIFQGLGTWTPQQHHILVEKKGCPWKHTPKNHWGSQRQGFRYLECKKSLEG